MARTITAANAVIFLAVDGLFNIPVQLQGFDVDDVFNNEAVTPAETRMGVDGRLSAGWTPAPVVLGIMLQADSPSVDFFEVWYQAQQVQRETYFASGSIFLSSVQRSYAFRRGVLTTFSPPTAKKVLSARTFSITWESVTIAPLF